jgi:PHD/YefM family antitoxin component YafN of YafNO toxin-antitoxin module
METMAAGEFKAKCLAVMDEVQAKRKSVTITKRGKPVAPGACGGGERQYLRLF